MMREEWRHFWEGGLCFLGSHSAADFSLVCPLINTTGGQVCARACFDVRGEALIQWRLFFPA